MATLTDREVARWRLRTQRLAAPHAEDAAAVVEHLLCVQAENVGQTAWAVAARTATPDAADLDALVADGRVVRTHVLRTTWHYARAEDIGWLLELTEPRVRRTIRKGLIAAGDFDDQRIDRMTGIVLDTLAAAPDRTRDELAEALGAEGLDPGGYALMLLLADLELRRLVVSGRPRDGVHTYARYEDRVPARSSTATRRWRRSRCATSPGTAPRPSTTSSTGRRSPAATPRRAWPRCRTSWSRSSTTAAPTGTRRATSRRRPTRRSSRAGTCC